MPGRAKLHRVVRQCALNQTHQRSAQSAIASLRVSPKVPEQADRMGYSTACTPERVGEHHDVRPASAHHAIWKPSGTVARANPRTSSPIFSSPPYTPGTSVRAFATSAAAPSDGSSFAERRKHVPESSWSRPHRPSQDADESAVPTYYVERKQMRDSISQRKEEEGGLMAELNAGILSEGLAAKTRVREEKIPVEVVLPDGTVAHPSGFEPPTPETDFHPLAAKVPDEVKQLWDEREFPVKAGAGVEEGAVPRDPELEAQWIARLVANGGLAAASPSVARDGAAESSAAMGSRSTSAEQRRAIPTSAWDAPAKAAERDDPDSVVPAFYIERKAQRAAIAERKEDEGELMAELNAGILSEGLAAETRVREEKIPVEVVLPDGTVAHPSGFEPPTAETAFHPTAAKPEDAPKTLWTEVAAVKATGGVRS